MLKFKKKIMLCGGGGQHFLSELKSTILKDLFMLQKFIS